MFSTALHQLNTVILPDSEPLITVYGFGSRIECSINSPTELFKLCQLVETLRRNGVKDIHLDIKYLMGQRMDRPISPSHPFTLKVVADIINSLKVSKVSVVCPHSDCTLAAINNAADEEKTEKGFFLRAIKGIQIISALDNHEPLSLVLPDAGMAKRYFTKLASVLAVSGVKFNVVVCEKRRCMETGKLSGFKITDGTPTARCLIIDDLCDGGGTFSGLSEVLRGAGAEHISLAVVHGIFSKGGPLPGIDSVYCTNSYFTNQRPDNIGFIPHSNIIDVFSY